MMLAGNVCSTIAGQCGRSRRRRRNLGRTARDRHALAGPHQVDDAQAQEQRHRGHDFEIENRLPADAAHVS